MTVITRFAPSPTGRLHLGHAYSALFAEQQARDAGGAFLVRVEDIDTARCRAEFDAGIMEDLAWLGLSWAQPVRRQSEHMGDYATALAVLEEMELLYPCFCTRSDIRREIDAAGHAPHDIPHIIPAGPDGPLYPGTCQRLSVSERQDRKDAGDSFALRLHMAAAVPIAGPLHWIDREQGPQLAAPQLFGDVVLARKDTPTSYHLAVTVDDHIQGVTLITRGEDLFAATHVHRLLQALLGLDTPDYHHHPLLTDDTGKRFAKRDHARTLMDLRATGTSPADIRHQLGYR
ncbi:MAG: tRNA glutamyl-Q(34) synthetase GluQRS [Rhodospirillales bacterium]|jgi:glutamyl-Q tRNA(Asp) synthetase|nr:tRNA glutamyl-Q(34) synthetase GluQRS [Rhodospirillales bacterium]MBT4041272.1 tRNA glutamyl-Q(34) synthetase GluQRS [Rhodospirillales bacterium]MBT4628093.1 tRNA glutamyl-Q(34) synthetase GluQRS [Rhodospirillales bacterium]MBT5351720.1 tRNA glutamyl-Q(34) synthetase GluQRS [Rhodospirillales bacterium]MBT5519334.1 tRNA glutamyl-Q(34) synthetase GluQRS [Rhodospirillales bacterium]